LVKNRVMNTEEQLRQILIKMLQEYTRQRKIYDFITDGIIDRTIGNIKNLFKSYVREIILSLENPYPEDIFLPIDQDTYEKIHEMLQKEFNMSIDRLAGHIGRKLWKGLRKSILRKMEEVEE